MPKILIWDIETGGVNALKADLGMMLCFGYKWLGEAETHVLVVCDYPGWFSTEHGINDKPLLEAALKIMEQADILVAHYGDKFDRRFFQGRCAIQKLMPPPPTKQRDTLRIARRAFNFSSNRLGNLAKVLKVKHQKHDKEADEWPGWWFRAMSGDAKAIRAMARYCAKDVQALEDIYMRLRVYDDPHPRLYTSQGTVTRCRLCGGSVHHRGIAFVGERRYRRYRCSKCGRWDRERKALKP